MPKSWFKLIAVAVSAIWFVGVSAIALHDWNRMEQDRATAYELCFEQSRDVAECKTLSAVGRRAALRDELIAFSIAGFGPIALLWIVVWSFRQRGQSRPAG